MAMYRVSDLIKLEDIKQWNLKDVITITAGCGTGKSYFIKNVLYDYAKENEYKILFLVHRSNCKNQFEEEIISDNKTDVIDITTYQSIESTILSKKEIDLDKYTYIIADEYQYFCDDATFNKNSDVSLNEILNSNTIKIFMSATDGLIKNYLKMKKKIEVTEYEVPSTFDFIRSLSFFDKQDTMFEIAEECLENNDKCIFFIQSAKLAYELYSKFKNNAIFNCSKSNKEYYKHVDEQAIMDILKNQKFDKNMLITTCAMDAGVNILDLELSHIICDVFDVNTLLQCIGRKRIVQEGDGFHLYIKSISNKQLGGIKTSTEKRLKKAEFLLDFGTEVYIRSYYKNTNDYSNIIYDDVVNGQCVKKVNELIYYKYKHTMLTIDNMISKGDYGYNKYFADLFGIERYRVLEEEKKSDDLESYLESILGQVMLQVKDRKELIERIDVKSNGKLLKKIGNLNGALEEREVSYRIVEFSTSKIINGKKKNFPNAWRIEKLTY